MKKLKYKQYRFYKLTIVILLAAIASAFVAAGNFIVPLVVFLIAIVLMFILNKNVDQKLTDERINAVSGRASRIVLTASAFLMAGAGIVLIALRDTNPQYLIIGNILIFLECGMMIFYAILFKFYSKRKI